MFIRLFAQAVVLSMCAWFGRKKLEKQARAENKTAETADKGAQQVLLRDLSVASVKNSRILEYQAATLLSTSSSIGWSILSYADACKRLLCVR